MPVRRVKEGQLYCFRRFGIQLICDEATCLSALMNANKNFDMLLVPNIYHGESGLTQAIWYGGDGITSCSICWGSLHLRVFRLRKKNYLRPNLAGEGNAVGLLPDTATP